MTPQEIPYQQNGPLDLVKHNQDAIAHVAGVEIEKSKAIESIQAALVIAKRFPRNTNQAWLKIKESCTRITLAQTAVYRYPRGGTTVTGPSIRLAEVLAQNYGNLDFGIREIERRADSSVIEAYCHDLENNTRQTKVFEVPHEMTLKNGQKKILKDSRDIYELVANYGARRMRACILGIIPGDIVDAAVNECKATVARGGGEPLADRIRKMIVAFKEVGVSQEMIEQRVGHGADLITGEEIADLLGVYQSLRDKHSKREDFFEFGNPEAGDSKAAALAEKLKQKKV